jgi:hypothetical protein
MVEPVEEQRLYHRSSDVMWCWSGLGSGSVVEARWWLCGPGWAVGWLKLQRQQKVFFLGEINLKPQV